MPTRDLTGDGDPGATPRMAEDMAQAMPNGIDLDECAEAAVERHNTQAATLILNVKYDLEEEDEPRAEWLQEQLKEMYERLRDD